MRNTLLVLVLLSFSLVCFSQNREFFGYKKEIGFDATELIGNFLSFTNPSDNTPSYTIFFRHHNENSSLRFDLSTALSRNSNLNGFGQDLVLTNKFFGGRFGWEKINVLGKRFALGYGLDAIYKLQQSKSSFKDNNRVNPVEVLVQNNTFGFGPVFRIHYRLMNRFVLSTESTLYGGVSFIKRENSLNEPPASTASNYFLELTKPHTISLSILF